MKKWKLLVLSALCISCFSVAACQKEEEKTNELVGFVDETVEIELGDIVSLRDFLEVYDEENNLYRATFELTDSSGSSVTLLANEFTVQDALGYTLVLSAHDPKTGEIIATRTVQLKTVDKSAPLITVGDMVEYGVIGEEIYVPLVFDDASQVYSTSVTAMRIPYSVAKNEYDESAAQKVAVEHVSKGDGASFTPTLQGRYKILIEAWDGTDKAAAQEAEVYRSKEMYLEVKTSEGEIEGFDLPSTTVAAYGVNPDTDKAEKTLAGNSVEWHETFNGRDGVISMKPAKTNTYGGAYYLRSTTKTTDFYKYGTRIDKNTLWNYVSAWIYVDGEAGETVEVSGEYDYDKRTIPCNAWYEYRIGMDYFVKRSWNRPWDTFSTEPNVSWDNRSFLYVGEDATADYTVYIDCFSYEKDEEISVNVALDASGSVAMINVSENAGYDGALDGATYEYVVRGYGTQEQWNETKQAMETVEITNTFTVFNGKFIPTPEYTEYAIGVWAKCNGTDHFAFTSYSVVIQNAMPANEIEGFYFEDSKTAAYGKRNEEDLTQSTYATKDYVNDTAQWWETFAGRTGVISLQGVRTHKTYGSLFYLRSTMRDSGFYKYSKKDNTITWTNSEQTWDYISIWLYVKGEAGEKVFVGDQYQVNKQEVDCNTWVELRLYREYLDGTAPAYFVAAYNQFEFSNNNRKSPLFSVSDGDKTTTDDYLVYVDSISYGKGEEVTVTESGTLKVGETITVTPTIAGYEGTTIDWTYVIEDAVGKAIVEATDNGTTATFTPTNAGEYLITVRAELDGGTVLYGSKLITVAASE